MEDILFNAVGIIGVILILLGYYLITKGSLTGDDLGYHLMNLCGAVLLLISLMWTWNLPSVIIELCWMSISIWGIFRILRRKNNDPSSLT